MASGAFYLKTAAFIGDRNKNLLKPNVGDDMSITVTELKQNFNKYLKLAAIEDVYITKNGKLIAKLTRPSQDRVKEAKSLFGILSSNVTVEEARDERLNRV